VIIWPDGAITNTWLQVTLEGNDEAGGFNTNTGLAASDVFYFGNRIGDTFQNSSPAVFFTNAGDQIAVRNNHDSHAWNHSLYDFNRNGLVNASDEIIARNNAGLLFRLNLPAPGEALAAAPLIAAAPVDFANSAIAPAIASRGAAQNDAATLPKVLRRDGESSGDVRPFALTTPDASHAERYRAVSQAVAELVPADAVEDDLLAELLAEL
jgi:hypothetical protein